MEYSFHSQRKKQKLTFKRITTIKYKLVRLGLDRSLL